MKGTIQLLFDGWMRGRHGVQVTGPMAYLTRAFAPAPNATREPPPFYVIGAPPISPTMQWVCNDLAIDPDSMIVRRADRKMLRANVTLSLLQYVPGDIVISPGAAKRSQSRHGKPGSGSKSASKTYTVRSGDTLSTIAAKQLGNYRRAGDIAKLNGIRAGAVLKAGQKLKLP